MARRKTRTVYRTVKRGYRARKGLLSGSLGNIVWGGVAGLVSGMIPNVLGKWTKPAVFLAGGYILKKPALMGIAGYELGKSISTGGIIQSGGGVAWE